MNLNYSAHAFISLQLRVLRRRPHDGRALRDAGRQHLPAGRQPETGTNCIKIGLPGKLILS